MHFPKYFLVKTIPLVLLFIFNAFSQIKTPIAVIDLNAEGISASESRIISSRLRTDLFNTDKFIVLERDKMNEILKEQGFQLSGCTTDECFVEIGKLIGVKQIVAGSVGKIGELITISIRLIDVQTGRVLKTATEDCKCSLEVVVTQSVKNVAEILSNKKVQNSSYKKNIRSESNTLNNQNIKGQTDWKNSGLERDEWVEFKRSELTINQWLDYKSKCKENYTSKWIPTYIIPTYSQFKTGHPIRGSFYLLVEAYSAYLWIENWEDGDDSHWRIPMFILIGTHVISIFDGYFSVKIYNNDTFLKQYKIDHRLSNKNKNIHFGFNYHF